METRTLGIAGAAVAGLAVVIGIIASLQGFNAEAVPCDGIAAARTQLQSQYDQAVNISAEVYRDQKNMIDEELSRCLSAKPKDPCEEAQKVRDQAVEDFNSIQESSYSTFNDYFVARDAAYKNYKKAKENLDNCRSNNPPPADPIPYEQSDTKQCFDQYDAAVKSIDQTFSENTQALRAALKQAMADLDAREKACHPPTGSGSFTNPPGGEETDGSDTANGTPAVELSNCELINPDLDSELFGLRQRAAQLPGEISDVQKSIDNANKRLSTLKRDLAEVDTYIPPESTKTQFEGALNALRAERKIAIEAQIEYYNNLIARKKAEKERLENELKEVNAKIAARLAQIQKENQARQRAFPTNIHLTKPDIRDGAGCAYFHCHGTLCGRQDPAPNACGHGSTTESDLGCKEFFKSYLRAAGV